MNLKKYKNLSDCFTSGPESRIRFIETGKKEVAPLFAMAGVDINTIKTIDELKQAYEISSPHMGQHHLNIAQNGKPSMERNALIAVVKGKYEEADRIIDLLQQKKALRLV